MKGTFHSGSGASIAYGKSDNDPFYKLPILQTLGAMYFDGENIANLAIEGDLPPIRTPATVSVSDTKGHGIILESDWGPFITTTLIKIRDQVRSIMSPKTAAASQPG